MADVEILGQSLWQAAEKGNKATVRLLLDGGADAESKDTVGQTPLLWAAKYGNEAVVKLLLDKDANVESKDTSGRTPLSWAAQNRHKAVVKLLDKAEEGRSPGY
ncbi:ankyrin repeat-containing protein [Fusarium tjaetaba]|uniref:Ankyrin repeat-containing protein n=1 Tax=Fusarium tjaetaba TaxID=1567544 RepID=A0A8H5S5J0_9HYPO|nr:ankyrin repeat-containing protein [Fusarium tjaetaba]KAF5645792.1 ankyrin repeat-containing protein [Fusarium tjaetaba]